MPPRVSGVPEVPTSAYTGYEKRVVGRSFTFRCLRGVKRGRHAEECCKSFSVHFDDATRPGALEELAEHRDAHRAAVKGFDDV